MTDEVVVHTPIHLVEGICECVCDGCAWVNADGEWFCICTVCDVKECDVHPDFCLRCRQPLTPEDVFEDGETRMTVVLNGDVEPNVTFGPLCAKCFRVEVGLDRPEAKATRDELVAEVQRLEVERDALVATLQGVQEELAKVSVFQGIGALPPVESVQQLVADHSELEARIEAVLVLPGHSGHPAATPEEYVVERSEVHRLLRGGKRVPDTVEEAFGDPDA